LLDSRAALPHVGTLKDEDTLWQAFQKLKNARNKFVHEGTPKIGNTAALTEMEALMLVGQAEAIVARIREWIPENLRWPVFVAQSKLEFSLPIFDQPKKEPTANPSSMV
jgi:hypothetical protein